MSPHKKGYRGPDGECDFSSMTFVIVSQENEGLNDISQSPQGKMI